MEDGSCSRPHYRGRRLPQGRARRLLRCWVPGAEHSPWYTESIRDLSSDPRSVRCVLHITHKRRRTRSAQHPSSQLPDTGPRLVTRTERLGELERKGLTQRLTGKARRELRRRRQKREGLVLEAQQPDTTVQRVAGAVTPLAGSSAWGWKLQVYFSLGWPFLPLPGKRTSEGHSLTTWEDLAENRGCAQGLSW